MSKKKNAKVTAEDSFYNDEDYHKVDCYISNDLYSKYEVETETVKMRIKKLRLELTGEEKIKIIYNWESVPKE